jgi:hypothetical protein
MEKRKIIIISLVSAVMSLIYVLLNYYGIIRYMSLYVYSTEGYAKKYKNLDKIGKYRTVISLTANQEQLRGLSHVIKSLLDQTVKVDVICVVVPEGDNYILPNNLKNSVSLYRCGDDKGLLNCLIYPVTTEFESTTKIITVGSGTAYGKDFIETLLDSSEKYIDNIIYENNEDLIDLNKGVVFSTNFFKEDFLKVEKGVDGNKWVNDYFKSYPKHKIRYKENYKSL